MTKLCCQWELCNIIDCRWITRERDSFGLKKHTVVVRIDIYVLRIDMYDDDGDDEEVNV